MNRILRSQLILGVVLCLNPDVVQAQDQAVESVVPKSAVAEAVRGSHGGTLRTVDQLQVETIVSESGIQVYLVGKDGAPVATGGSRGVAAVRVEAGSKRYRYNLLPDEQGGLTARVNLSKVAGSPLTIEIQLVGVSKTSGQPISYKETAVVPRNALQLAAAAIASQKTCPVSGKPLGSMGDPVAVGVGDQRVFVCCAGCVAAVKSNPSKYARKREISVKIAVSTSDDLALITKQAKCPVMDEPLGSMGQPVKLLVGGKPVFLCCKGCVKKVQADPAKYLAVVYGDNPVSAGKIGSGGASVAKGTDEVRPGIFKVTAADQPFIAAQKICPVMDEPLDAMGGPYKVNAAGKAIYICCPGCAKKIAAEPDKYLAVLKSLGVESPTLR